MVVVIGVDWVVAMVDLMLVWGIKVILISMVVLEHCRVSWSSWMPVVELRVVVGMLLVIIIGLRVVAWSVAHMSLVVSVDSAALVVGLVKVIVIMLNLVAFHHVSITSIAVDNLVDQAVETCVMSWLMVVLSQPGSFAVMRHFFEGIVEFVTILVFIVDFMWMDNSIMRAWKDDGVVWCVVVEVWLWVN